MKLLPISFGIRLGNLTLISVSLFDQDEEEPVAVQSDPGFLDFGFAPTPPARLSQDEPEEETPEVPLVEPDFGP